MACGLVPDDTKRLPEPMLIYHRGNLWHSPDNNFTRKAHEHPWQVFGDYTKNISQIQGASELTVLLCLYISWLVEWLITSKFVFIGKIICCKGSGLDIHMSWQVTFVDFIPLSMLWTLMWYAAWLPVKCPHLSNIDWLWPSDAMPWHRS